MKHWGEVLIVKKDWEMETMKRICPDYVVRSTSDNIGDFLYSSLEYSYSIPPVCVGIVKRKR